MVESDDLWLHYRNLLHAPIEIDGPHRACTGVHSVTAGNSIMTSIEGGFCVGSSLKSRSYRQAELGAGHP